MPRVMVCGCSGSGKTTFARQLAAMTGGDYLSIDAHFWQPGWIEGSRESLRERMAPLYAGENWVSDGNYFSALGDIHLPRATHVYFFDLPRWIALTGALWRVASAYGKVRPEMAPGCPERFDLTFFRYIWNYRERQRPSMFAAFATMRPEQNLMTLHSRRAAAVELARIAREGLA